MFTPDKYARYYTTEKLLTWLESDTVNEHLKQMIRVAVQLQML